MKYPKFIQKGDSIGVVGTSGAITSKEKEKRIKNAILNIQKQGYKVKEADNLYVCSDKNTPGDGKVRGEAFNKFIKDDSITYMNSIAGGDYLNEMLEYVDFNAIKEHPKWFQGFSDNTGLVYPIVTNCDVAAIYGGHFGNYGMEPWQQNVYDTLNILSGKTNTLHSYDYYEDEIHDYVTGLEPYAKDKEVKWINGNDEKEITMNGRLIGGCLDVLVFLLGTKYDNGLNFIEKYKEDGIIWVFETYSMEDTIIFSHLWQMKSMGYFKYVKGFIFGRPLFYNSYSNTSYKDIVTSILGDLHVPMIFDADIGHKDPQFPLVMGSIATITSKDGKGTITYNFK